MPQNQRVNAQHPARIPAGVNGENPVLAQLRRPLGPAANREVFVVALAVRQLSGAAWVQQYPTSVSTDDLTSPFRENVISFLAALTAAGAAVTISATLRPPERAFLMHWSWRIVNEDVDPRTVPSREGINIRWDHLDADGNYSASASVAAARAMVNAYGMQNLRDPPALNSRHIEGNAIDMSIGWEGTLRIVSATGRETEIATVPRTGMNVFLRSVGASYGVIKYRGGERDRPHWSSDGR